MKAIIQAYSPEEVERIARGEQTIKVCKTAPKETSFKVYMYCTKEGMDVYGNAKRYVIDTIHILNENAAKAFEETTGLSKWNGKVVGEFVCDKVYKIVPDGEYYSNGYDIDDDMLSEMCLGRGYLTGYGLGYTIYGWHITAPKLYDKPKELGEFRKVCLNGKCSDCIYEECKITRPPQSWQYVEKLQ